MSSGKGPHALAAEERRREAEAAALRANLKRRKTQLRGRQAQADEAAIASVVDFWFGAENDPDRENFRSSWFQKSDAFDTACTDLFGDLTRQAAVQNLSRWADTQEGGLATILLLDQMPRNIHRGTAQAFATDPQALALAKSMVARGFDRALAPVMRLFVYLPFTHAEDIAEQDTCVKLVEALPESSWREVCVKSAHAHRDVILRFGRFAHRNAILGRASTPDELVYLADPNAGF